MHVTAIVVTYRRPDVLARTLAAVAAQTRPPNVVMVVDNDPVGSARSVCDGVVYELAGSNDGYGAGIAVGVERAGPTDAFWILDDDSTPSKTSLERNLAHLGPGVGAVANRGGHLRFGRIRHDLAAVADGVVAEADFTLIDGTVVAAEAMRGIGPLRRDLFMMMEDFDITTRIKAAGYRLLVVGGDTSHHAHMGSSASWRGYYQARNLLRIAIERRSPSMGFGWAARESAIQARQLVRRDWQRLRWRWRGIADGVRGQMGPRPGAGTT